MPPRGFQLLTTDQAWLSNEHSSWAFAQNTCPQVTTTLSTVNARVKFVQSHPLGELCHMVGKRPSATMLAVVECLSPLERICVLSVGSRNKLLSAPSVLTHTFSRMYGSTCTFASFRRSCSRLIPALLSSLRAGNRAKKSAARESSAQLKKVVCVPVVGCSTIILSFGREVYVYILACEVFEQAPQLGFDVILVFVGYPRVDPNNTIRCAGVRCNVNVWR